MSRTLSAPRWGSGAAIAGILSLLLAAFAFGLAAQANAAFTTPKCGGEDIDANGASFANNAHALFKERLKDNFCQGTPFSGSSAPVLTYNGNGSGAGREAMMNRGTTSRFAGSDEPPLPEEIQKMNTGVGPAGNPAADPDPSDNGQIHVIPAAIGAITPLVNFPDTCDVSQLTGGPTGERTEEENTNGGATDDVMRVRFTRQQFERMWAGDPAFDTWGEVFDSPGFTCAVPVIRVVRFDNSGSTFALKDYLDKLDPTTKWQEDFVFGDNDTRDWPNAAAVGPRQDCPPISPGVFPIGPGADSSVAGEPGADNLTSSCSSGGGALADTVIAEDGSIGYADLATARGKALTIVPEADDNDKYWTQLPDGSAGTGVFTEPTQAAKGFRADVTQKGANCAGAEFTNDGASLPSTLGNWANVSGVNSPDAFPTCTLTYGLVFDDNSDVWGTDSEEEKKARTVKDYWENVVTTSTQVALTERDYGPLPAEILTISKAGVASIDWEKGPSGGGGGGGTGGGGGGGGGDTGGGSVTPPVVPPSNKFSLPRKTISSKTGDATISVNIPGPGKVVLLGTAKAGKKQIKVGQVTLNANQGGTFSLKLKPSAAAKKVLQEKGQLKVSLKVTFTPTGGSQAASTSSVTLKLSKKGK